MFKDKRMPAATVFENLQDMSVEEVMEEFDVTREQNRSGTWVCGSEPSVSCFRSGPICA